MMPIWRMKLTPLARLSRSFSGVMPSRIDGVRKSSSSLKIHCASARKRTSDGRAGFCSAEVVGTMLARRRAWRVEGRRVS